MQKVVEGERSPGAPPPVVASAGASPRPRARWLLIALPVALLVAKAVVAIADALPLGTGGALSRSLIEIGLASASLFAAAALVAGRRIGWLLALWIVGWDLVVLLVRWWLGEPSYVVLALAAVVAFLLTTRDMQVAYGARRAP